MKVIIFGATGMVGSGVLHECLKEPLVDAILVIGRRPSGVTHPKIHEILHEDFFGYGAIQAEFAGYDACFFCLGVTSVGKNEDEYRHLTYDLTLAAASSISAVNGSLTFCYVSGTGTDGTERGCIMWARVKGRTENALLRMPFKAAYMFRPGYIQPLEGVRSKTAWYQALYAGARVLYPVLRRLFPRYVTTTVNVGRAMIHVARSGYSKRVLESDDINRAAQAAM
jgi:uncharacterized protein YbjT (DUF2867 family)